MQDDQEIDFAPPASEGAAQVPAAAAKHIASLADTLDLMGGADTLTITGGSPACLEAAAFIRAQLDTPPGFALAPTLPTDDMLVAGQEAWSRSRAERSAIEDCHEAAAVWRAMLAAAPASEGAAQVPDEAQAREDDDYACWVQEGGPAAAETQRLRLRAAAPEPQAAQPVAWMRPSVLDDCYSPSTTVREEADDWCAEGHKVTPLYATPQAGAAPVALPIEQIVRIASMCDSDACDGSQTTAFARAIERAHGIVGAPDAERLTAVPVAPIGFMSSLQLPLIVDVDGDHGVYIPMRKTARGNFTLALYAAPLPAAAPVALTDERIDYIADKVVRGMPDGLRGFQKVWGWQQFARALLEVCAPLPAAAPVGEALPPFATWVGLGSHQTIAHDGFAGTVQGYYTTREGKQGVVLQQDGTRVVHVYGDKWLSAALTQQTAKPGEGQ